MILLIAHHNMIEIIIVCYKQDVKNKKDGYLIDTPSLKN